MKIGFVYGYSEGQVLEKFGKQIAPELATFGITLHTVDMRDSDSFLKNIISIMVPILIISKASDIHFTYHKLDLEFSLMYLSSISLF